MTAVRRALTRKTYAVGALAAVLACLPRSHAQSYSLAVAFLNDNGLADDHSGCHDDGFPDYDIGGNNHLQSDHWLNHL